MTPPIIPPIHRDGWKFVAAFAVVTLVLFALWSPLGWVGVIATLWCLWFFRDPPRVTPLRAGLVISPADGIIVAIREATPPLDLGMGPAPMRRISIFLNIFDVHINRAPVAGRVIAKAYHPGRFLNASLDKASDENERTGLRLAMDNGTEIAVVQIAGLIARRILCWVGEGDALAAGQRFGLIRFGSRTDLYLPLDWSIAAIEGQRVLGGETILADALSSEPQRLGAVR